MIILLDLNYTLVSNSDEKHRPFSRQIEHETYHPGILHLVRPHTVYLVTARPALYERETLKSLKTKTGWQPDKWFFNRGGSPPVWKEKVLQLLLDADPSFQDAVGQPGGVIALESNPRTREMYWRYNIPTIMVSRPTPES